MSLNSALRDALARQTGTTTALVDALAKAVTHHPGRDNDVLLRDFIVILNQEADRR